MPEESVDLALGSFLAVWFGLMVKNLALRFSIFSGFSLSNQLEIWGVMKTAVKWMLTRLWLRRVLTFDADQKKKHWTLSMSYISIITHLQLQILLVDL